MQEVRKITSVIKKILIVLLCILLISAVSGTVYISAVNPHRDNIQSSPVSAEFHCDKNSSYITYQTDGKCAAYASAYVLRCLGERADGESLYPDIRRTFGFVSPGSIVKLFESRGYSAKACCGDTDTLKQRISEGVPVIVFISIPQDTHYAAVTGYDSQYLYLADSLIKNANTDGKGYNRKLTYEEFEKVWKTDTVLSDNIYIVVKQ